MKPLLHLRIAALLAPLLATGVAAAPLQDRGQDDGSGRELVAKTELDLLLAYYAKAQGGAATLEGIKNFTFDLTPVVLVDGEEVEQPKMRVEVDFAGSTRMVRLEEEVEGKSIVKLSDGLSGGRVWVDGQEREIPEMSDQALTDARILLVYLDLLYRPDSPELARRFNGIRKRDGVDYRAMHLEFHESRQIAENFRNYYHPETALVERIDVYDGVTLMRTRTVLVEGYENLGGIKFPTRLVFEDRDGKPQARWRLESAAINADLDPTRFQAL